MADSNRRQGKSHVGENQLQEVPATASNLVITTPRSELRVFTFYLKFTDLTTQADLSSLPVAALPNSFLSY